MEVKICYRILAVRSREKFAIELANSIAEPLSSIMWDEDKKGCPWNNNRACKEFLKTKEYTHLCLIDDDAVVVNGFK